MSEKRKRNTKVIRSETVTIRLDPKVRYFLEIASIKQRRTLSSCIEWAIDEMFKSVVLQEGGFNDQRTIADEIHLLWDVDEADRFVKLCFRYPDLLTYEQQKLWKLICENGALWKGGYDFGIWVWDKKDIKNLDLSKLRIHWADFVAVAKNEASFDILPKWDQVITPAMYNAIPSEGIYYSK